MRQAMINFLMTQFEN